MVLLNCQLHWSVTLVVMSLSWVLSWVLGECGLNCNAKGWTRLTTEAAKQLNSLVDEDSKRTNSINYRLKIYD